MIKAIVLIVKKGMEINPINLSTDHVLNNQLLTILKLIQLLALKILLLPSLVRLT